MIGDEMFRKAHLENLNFLLFNNIFCFLITVLTNAYRSMIFGTKLQVKNQFMLHCPKLFDI